MKKSVQSDSQADAVAAVLLVLLAVAFAAFDARGQGTKHSLRCGVCRRSVFADAAVRAGALDAQRPYARQSLERVAKRPAVVSPSAGIDDHGIGQLV